MSQNVHLLGLLTHIISYTATEALQSEWLNVTFILSLHLSVGNALVSFPPFSNMLMFGGSSCL